nr:hypothetical protein [Myroides sp. WP-1]
MLTITDSDGNTVELDVTEIANNTKFVTELTNNMSLITNIVNKLKGKYGNVVYNVTEKKFYHIKEDGTQELIDWADFNTTNESFTLVNDQLTITDSDGNTVALNVEEIASNTKFITKLTENETLINNIVNKLAGKYGNVVYNVTEKKFYHIKTDGTQEEIDWTDFNTTNESFTLVNDQLTITDSDGNTVALNVEEIASNTKFITKLTENETLINNIVNKLAGKYGNVVYNVTEKKFYHIKTDGTQEEIDWTDFNTTNESFTLVNDQLTITDSDGNTVALNVEEIASNTKFITKLTENETLINNIVNKLAGKYGNVVYNVTEKKFYHIKTDGTQEEIDWTDFNTTNESFTLVNDQLTITDSDGNTVALNVEEIASNTKFITKLTENETLINNIVNKLAGKYGNVVYNVTEKKFYHIKTDGTQEEIDWTDFNTTNESFTLVNDQLTITDSDGNTVALNVEEIASNTKFITKLTENENLINNIVNKLTGKYGNVVYNVTEKKFYHIKTDGTQEEIDWTDFNTTNESFTLVNDQLTITDSEGNTVALNVEEIASNTKFITKLTENENLINNIVNKLTGKYGNVVYNVTEKKFYHIKTDGTQEEIDWTDFNTTNESFTLVNDQLTITDSDGNTVALNVEEIASNTKFITKLTENETLINNIVNKLAGKYGNVFYNVTDKKFYHIKTDGTKEEIDWTDFNTTNESFTLVNDQLTITDSEGNTVALNVEEIASNTKFITKLTENETLINNIVNKLAGKYGNVFYNVTDKKFYHIKTDGTKEEIDWTDFNTTNESFTLVNDQLTITDSEGNTVALNVEEIASNQKFITEMISQLDGKYGNMVYNSTSQKYFYIKTDGTLEELNIGVTADLAGDVTGPIGTTHLAKIQGNPVSAATVTNGQALVFDGTSWVPGTPDVDATKVTDGKNLGSDASITVTDGTAALLKESTIKVADGGITTTHIKNGTILPEDLAASPAANQVLVTDGNNVPGWANPSVLSTSPWLVQGSTTIATLNTQNIFQMGTIAIGANEIPSTEPTAKLYVAGDVVTTGKYFTTNAVYADYVFEKYFTGSSDIKLTYEFNSLKDIANFVKENHHLPGVTPIGDLAKNDKGYGFDLTNLSVELLEKVEELFLHTIEQQNQIDQLKQEQEAVAKRLELIEKLMEKK